MTPRHQVNRALPLSLLLLAVPVAEAQVLTKTDYNQGKVHINSQLKSDKTACATKAGNPKDVCVEEAKAAQTEALAETKRSQQIEEAARAAAQTTLDADCKVAIEKSNASAGDPKTACAAAAKARSGHN